MRKKSPMTRTQYRCTTVGGSAQMAGMVMDELLTDNHSGTYVPYVVAWRGLMGMVWREPQTYRTMNDRNPSTWNYTVVAGNYIDRIDSMTTTGTTSTTIEGARTEAVAALRWSMAQRLWNGMEDDISLCAGFCDRVSPTNGPTAFKTWATEVLKAQRKQEDAKHTG